jgi:hypothetical protein
MKFLPILAEWLQLDLTMLSWARMKRATGEEKRNKYIFIQKVYATTTAATTVAVATRAWGPAPLLATERFSFGDYFDIDLADEEVLQCMNDVPQADEEQDKQGGLHQDGEKEVRPGAS